MQHKLTLINAVKEQQRQIENLAAQNLELKAQDANLTALVNRICSNNGALCR